MNEIGESVMRYVTAIFAGLSIFLTASAAQACSCAGTDPFVQAAHRSSVVVRSKVLDYQWYPSDPNHKQTPIAMTVEVQETYKGIVKSKQLTVGGDNGMQCRPYVMMFPIGTEWVLALGPDHWTKKGELAIFGCGEYWLPVQNATVTGRITEKDPAAKPKTMTLAQFRQILKTVIPKL
jgi:hypothetical protein